MNIESIGREAIEIIKSKWGLPKSGFLAGGCLANLMWELVSGNKAVVNDIDIFCHVGEVNHSVGEEKKYLFNYRELKERYYEDYGGMAYQTVKGDNYVISDVSKKGIFNIINYRSKEKNLLLILRSFDINATGVGFSIEEDKLYWTGDFVDFLQSGDLKVTNLMTPAHTAIRITKKKTELAATVSEMEYKILQHAIDFRFSDIIKLKFKERYFQMYKKFESELSQYFNIQRDHESEEYVLREHLEEVQLWRLTAKKPIQEDLDIFGLISQGIFVDDNFQRIHKSDNFLFYIRNIHGNKDLESIWSKVAFYYKDKDYIDIIPEEEDIELLERFSKYAPKSIENLKGLRLSQQINLIKKFVYKFKDDPIVAISILEKWKFNEDIDIDEETSLLLELSVRREIINDTRGKVNSILKFEEPSPQVLKISDSDLHF